MKFLPQRAPGACPEVSVVIGVKNGVATLQRCLDSIAAQEFASRETIVIDSASTDGTRELLESNRRSGKVTEYVSEPDGGLYEAWNKGVLRSRGDWICFLGCDDAFHDPLALRHLTAAATAARGTTGMVYGLVNRVTHSGLVAEVWGGPWKEWKASSFAGFMIPHPGSLHHRSIFEQRGLFDESYRIAGDYELVLRELLVREPVFVGRVVVDMRFGGMSSKPAAIYKTLLEVQRARAAHGLRGKPARLRQALAAAWIGSWIQSLLGDRAYRYCADLYRIARGKPQDLDGVIRVLTFGRYADDNFGGVERYVFELARGLRGEAHFTNIVAARGGAPDTELAGDTIQARPWLNLAGTPVCPTMPWHALRRQPFDLVHLQFPADPMAHLATSLLPASVPRVISWHSDIVRQERLLKLYRPFLDRLLRSTSAIIAATPAHLESSTQLAAARGHASFHVIPYGLDLARFQARPPLADELRRRHADRFLVFALGRHVYYKGFEFLIRALAELPQAVLILGGQGPLTGRLVEVAREAGVADRVDFAGRIPETDLPAYYHACDVYCLPSVERAEAFGIVQVEAMASGKPVLCCELHNGVTWVNQDGVTGLVVPPADPAALAGALRRLADDAGLRSRLGAQARERALGTFTQEAMARATLDVYRRALQSRL